MKHLSTFFGSTSREAATAEKRPTRLPTEPVTSAQTLGESYFARESGAPSLGRGWRLPVIGRVVGPSTCRSGRCIVCAMCHGRTRQTAGDPSRPAVTRIRAWKTVSGRLLGISRQGGTADATLLVETTTACAQGWSSPRGVKDSPQNSPPATPLRTPPSAIVALSSAARLPMESVCQTQRSAGKPCSERFLSEMFFPPLMASRRELRSLSAFDPCAQYDNTGRGAHVLRRASGYHRSAGGNWE